MGQSVEEHLQVIFLCCNLYNKLGHFFGVILIQTDIRLLIDFEHQTDVCYVFQINRKKVNTI